MPTLAEKIEAIVREAFQCSRNCRGYSSPITHSLQCPALHTSKALDACRRAANLAIEEAAEESGGAFDTHQNNQNGLHWTACVMIEAIRALALPEDNVALR